MLRVPKVATFLQLILLAKKLCHVVMAKCAQILIKIFLELGDGELLKKLRKSVKNWIFGSWHKFYKIRELFQKELGITH
jgi:hypothetical protein